MASILDSVSRIISSPLTPINALFLVGLTVFTTVEAITISHLLFAREKIKVIKSPTATLLPKLSSVEKNELPYPPDSLPGGRDVESPYGTTRVFEWGPEDGRKVLLVHGMTTPCIALGAVAHDLVKRGCRVMLFDEWGRGYSDTPADLEHDERLYSTQILIAVTSSPLPWTGGSNGGFSIIGYSQGGGISICFTSYFPDLVQSIVLLAPTGLIRPYRLSLLNRAFSYLIYVTPELLLSGFLKKRLQKPIFAKENSEDLATVKATGKETLAGKIAPVSLKYPDITVMAATQWILLAHDGFIRSFLSALKYGPGGRQQAAWKRLSLQKRTILIFTATHDPVIFPEDLKPDVEGILQGSGSKVEWCELDGAHDFPITHSRKVVEHICSFWGM